MLTFQWYYGLLENLRGISQWIVVSAGGKFEDKSRLMLNYVYIGLPNQYHFSLSLFSVLFWHNLIFPLPFGVSTHFLLSSSFSLYLEFLFLLQSFLLDSYLDSFVFSLPIPFNLRSQLSEYLFPLDQFTRLGVLPV